VNSFATKLSQEFNILPSNLESFGTLSNSGFLELNKNLNFFIPSNSDTNFNALAIKYKEIDPSNKSVIKYLEPFINQYLWNEVRVKNGAYGAHFELDTNSQAAVFYSYSDPKINETYKIYSNTKTNFNLAKFKKYSFEKMKLRFLSRTKVVYRNEDIYKISFFYYMTGKSFDKRKSELETRVVLNFNQFKDLVKTLKNIKYSIKAIATTKERIQDFSEKYETLT